ncbi:HAMP domain-containing protein [Paroceanicella profunda]|uniref:HAMP domain-containing protein n=1 Tax=Paroceanicella profunda TaxID=2579971 RepID=A0A5B8FYU5_9RHOB|nr:methyl-accepting chemotaxis protein [Paroceanicella profunda]QDL92570.1 HAMP domain-containing protein [Paroceanicella profunda]
MLNRLGMQARIAIGFVPPLMMMLVLSLVAYNGVSSITTATTTYLNAAGDQLELSRMGDCLTDANVAVLLFDRRRTPNYVEDFRTNVACMRDMEEKLTERAAVLESLVNDYATGFSSFVALDGQKAAVRDKALDFGPWTSVALQDIIRTSYRGGNLDAMLTAGEVNTLLNRSLALVERFLRAEDLSAETEAQARIDEAAAAIETLKAQVSSDLQRGRVAIAEALMENYRARVSEARALMEKEVAARARVLDTLAPGLSAQFQDIDHRLRQSQEALGQETVDTASATGNQVTIITIAVLAGSLALSWVIGRWISRSVGNMANTMREIAEGNTDVEVQGAEHQHQLGEMARSLIVFQENARARTEAEAEARAGREAADAQRLQQEEERRQQEAAREKSAAITKAALETFAAGLDGLSGGDLTVRIGSIDPAYDAMRLAFNQTMERLEDTVGRIKASSASMMGSTTAIVDSAQELSGRAESQASSLEETAATMEQMSASVKTTAESAQQVRSAALDASERARRGSGVVSDAVQAMGRIEESSAKVTNIIGAIDAIAFQTNLLALNAAVEAARAGEAGKGFAVVASEVRTLAQRAAEAAKDIADLIRDSTGQVADGARLVREAGDALVEIRDAIETVASRVADISSAASEQASGVEEITTTVTHLDSLTQQNSALAEQSAANARSLGADADELVNLMTYFSVTEGAPSGRSRAA